MNEYETLVTTKIIGEIATEMTRLLCNSLKDSTSDFVAKNEIRFNNAFKKYLKKSKDHYEMTKTILCYKKPCNLYSLYECTNLEFPKMIIDSNNIQNLLNLGNKLIITGTGGSGKSMLLRHLFLNTIVTQNKIPVLIELRGLNEIDKENIIIEEQIYKSLNTFGFDIEDKYFKYSLELGKYVFFFEGYDELNNDLSGLVAQKIRDFANKYNDNAVIISSRPLQQFIGWTDFIELECLPLTKKQALSLIDKLEYDSKIKEKFCLELEQNLYDNYQSFASNPLLLTIMLMSFKESLIVPNRMIDFFEQAFSTLFYRHDRLKSGYKRDILSKLSLEDFKSIFSYFCFISFFENNHEFTHSEIMEKLKRAKNKNKLLFDSSDYIDDLTNAVCVLILEELEYTFSHRMFQEYFAAVYTCQLSDNIQSKLIEAWLKESGMMASQSYLEMLYELEKKRFIQNVFIPGLRQIDKLYQLNGNSYQVIAQELYSCMIIDEGIDGKPQLCLVLNNQYFHNIINCVKKINNYSINQSIYQQEHDNLIGILLEDFDYGDEIPFEIINEKKLNNKDISLDWLFADLKFVLSYYHEIKNDNINKKRKLETLLNEL